MLVKINFMAIKNTETNEYYKIDKESLAINIERIVLLEYKDKQHRTYGDSKWLFHKRYDIFLTELPTEIENVDVTQSTEKNLKNIITTVAYQELKKLPEYTGYEDC